MYIHTDRIIMMEHINCIYMLEVSYGVRPSNNYDKYQPGICLYTKTIKNEFNEMITPEYVCFPCHINKYRIKHTLKTNVDEINILINKWKLLCNKINIDYDTKKVIVKRKMTEIILDDCEKYDTKFNQK